jgi:hypothetical protein
VNTQQLRNNIGQLLRLRPHPQRVTGYADTISTLTSGDPRLERHTVKTDYDWLLVDVTSGGVALRCPYTGHEVSLGPDNVREFRTPNFLLLKGQLILEGDGVRFEPS